MSMRIGARTLWLLLTTLAWVPHTHAQSLIEGVDSWAEATVGVSTSKWVGPRISFPEPRTRPRTTGRLDSLLWPISVHVGAKVSRKRALRVLAASEHVHALLAAAGFLEQLGDGGQGGTGGRDLYVMDQEHGADAAIDATEPMWGLDGARAYALLDARVPEDRLEACTAQAIAEALLFEQDPAEATSVRKSSAAYLAYLMTGQLGCDDDAERRDEAPWRAVMSEDGDASGASWLRELDRREASGSGVFLWEMWQFARQRTWEGKGLRASPDLLEVIAKALDLRHEQLEEVAGELADRAALAGLTPQATSHLPWREVREQDLPEHLPPADPPIEPLGSYYALIRLNAPPKVGDRLRVWSRGEVGTRWALSATRVDGQGSSRGRVSAPPRKNPSSYVIVELDPETRAVLVSVTNVADGIPDPDLVGHHDVRSVALIVDRGGTPAPM